MERFLTNKEFLFFPEIILGGYLGEETKYGTGEDTLLTALQMGKKFKKQFSNFYLESFIKSRIKLGSNYKILFSASIKINDNVLSQESLFEEGFRKFSRIDGNHRLCVLDLPEDFYELSVEDKQKAINWRDYLINDIGDLNTPFCLVFFDAKENLCRQYKNFIINRVYWKFIML